jgi:hypothetical protein
VSDPVTVFLLVVAGLLVVGTLGERVFAAPACPAVIWLVALGILVRRRRHRPARGRHRPRAPSSPPSRWSSSSSTPAPT